MIRMESMFRFPWLGVDFTTAFAGVLGAGLEHALGPCIIFATAAHAIRSLHVLVSDLGALSHPVACIWQAVIRY